MSTQVAGRVRREAGDVSAHVTVWRDNKGTRVNAARLMDLSEIERVIRAAKPARQKDDLPLLKLASFGESKTAKGSLRHDPNVTAVYGVEGDYDGEQLPMQHAADVLSSHGCAAILYDSPSSTPERPRWRVIVPLSLPLEGSTEQLRAQHRHWTGVLNALLEGILAGESFTLSQSYYFGRVDGTPEREIIRLDGCCLDQLEEIPTPVFPSDEQPRGRGNGHDQTAATLDGIASGEHIYQTTRDYAARLIAKGFTQAEVLELLRGYLLGHRDTWTSDTKQQARWQEVWDKLPNMVSGADGKFGKPSGNEQHEPLADIRAAILADLNAGAAAVDAATAPRWVAYPVLPVAGASLAGPGGTGKTALVLSEMVQITAGHELYGHPVDMQGACGLVTAEDGANHARYILQQLLRDGVESAALPQRAAERAKHDIRIIGWPRAKYGPIVHVDQFGGLHRADVYDLLLELLQPLSPVYVTLDPCVLFSAGERYGNDGDAYLAAMLHETALTMGACMQLVDHVAQSVVRNGIIDQYAARGGTAKSDNARLARQLVRVTPEAAESLTLPLSVSAEDIAEGRLLQLHITKSNYAPRPAPVWLRRRRYWIEQLRAPDAAERATVAQQEREDETAADGAILVEYVRQQLSVGTGIRMSQRDVEGAGVTRPDGTRISRDQTRLAIHHAIAIGALTWRELPPAERRGQRRTYLAPAEAP